MLAAHDLFRSICIYIKDDLSDASFAIEDFLGKTGHVPRAAAIRCLFQCPSPVCVLVTTFGWSGF